MKIYLYLALHTEIRVGRLIKINMYKNKITNTHFRFCEIIVIEKGYDVRLLRSFLNHHHNNENIFLDPFLWEIMRRKERCLDNAHKHKKSVTFLK